MWLVGVHMHMHRSPGHSVFYSITLHLIKALSLNLELSLQPVSPRDCSFLSWHSCEDTGMCSLKQPLLWMLRIQMQALMPTQQALLIPNPLNNLLSACLRFCKLSHIWCLSHFLNPPTTWLTFTSELNSNTGYLFCHYKSYLASWRNGWFQILIKQTNRQDIYFKCQKEHKH